MPKFTHIHVHSHYSLLDGLPKIDEILDYVKELGMDSVALTDHGVLYGAVEFFKKAKQKGVKPIIGAEMYMAFERMQQKRPNIDDKRYHLVLLVKNEEGYKNLVKLITLSHLEGFYYKPRIDEETLAEYSSGLICLSGCIRGKIPQLILAKKFEEAEKLAQKYQEIFGPDNFYLEIQNHPNSPDYQKSNQGLITLSKKLAIPLVATNDIHYLKPEDAEAQDILMLINTGANLNDPERLTMKSDDFSMRSPEEMTRLFKNTPQAIENTQKIAELCNFEFVLGKTQLPYFEVPEGKTPEDYLKELCYQGLEKRLQPTHHPLTHHPTLNRKEVIDRLEYELSVIKQTGFASYFLIVQDFVNWAKENRIIVGPGRGSVGGSLVAYLLNITNVNPLKYDLLFERFLHLERSAGLPDIDLDFTDRRRDEVINYVAEKYGRDKVAQIITFGTMAARAAVRDAGRALGLSYGFCDQLAKLIPALPHQKLDDAIKKVPELNELYKNNPDAKKVIDAAFKLEGVARHASVHAAGVVVSKEPLTDYVPLQRAPQNENIVITQFDMYSIEDLGLLKIDLLGLKNLTIIEEAIRLIKEIQGEEIKISQIPLDDKKTFKLLQETDTTGIFQLESSGMRRYLRELKPTELEDIIAMVALYRPGPIELIPSFINRKHGREKVKYLHPKLEPILEKTYGIGIYQEQMMRIARDLAGFSLAEADTLRKAIGKKIKVLLGAQKEKLLRGMMENGIDEPTAKQIWELFPPFARYGFNRSHAACYALIGYWTAYLKSHWPIEFMTALLNADSGDTERIAFLISEAQKNDINILAPDINKSFVNFVPEEKNIRFGLLAIKNVGLNIVQAIIEERQRGGPFQNFSDFLIRVRHKDLNKKSLESLIKVGVFDSLNTDRAELLAKIEEILAFSQNIKRSLNSSQISLFGANYQASPGLFKKELNGNGAPIPDKEKLSWEKELVGLYISGHPLNQFSEKLKNNRIKPIKELLADKRGVNGNSRRIAGVISNVKRIISKLGQPILFAKIEDLGGGLEVIVFSDTLAKNPTVWRENNVVIVEGRLSWRNNEPKFICQQAVEL